MTEDRELELEKEVENARPGGLIACELSEMDYIAELFENVSFHGSLRNCTVSK